VVQDPPAQLLDSEVTFPFPAALPPMLKLEVLIIRSKVSELQDGHFISIFSLPFKTSISNKF
jgi:hypothetical protein